MIKKSVFEEEIISNMHKELLAQSAEQSVDNLEHAVDYLHSAIDILEEAGLTQQADQVLNILYKIANEHHKKSPHKDVKKDDVIEFKSLKNEQKKLKPNDVITFNSIKDKEPEEFSFESLLIDDQNAKTKKHKLNDPHIKGLTSEKMINNLKEHGTVFNMADDGKGSDLLNADVSDDLEVSESDLENHDFEDEID